MKLPDYTLTISEPVACVKPGRTLLFRLCFVLVLLIGIPAMGVLIWAEVTSFTLNSLPWLPRIGLAAVVGLCAFGVYQSIREEQVRLTLRFYKDRLVLSYEGKPSLWREGAPAEETVIRYDRVQRCVLNVRRCRVTIVAKDYVRTVGEAAPRKKGGAVSFSVLGAQDVNISKCLEDHSPMNVIVKN